MRMKPEARRNEILIAAVDLASKPGGFNKLTRRAIAEKAGCSEGLVSAYFFTMPRLKRSIMKLAVKNQILQIIGQGIACGDKIAIAVPKKLYTAALRNL